MEFLHRDILTSLIKVAKLGRAPWSRPVRSQGRHRGPTSLAKPKRASRSQSIQLSGGSPNGIDQSSNYQTTCKATKVLEKHRDTETNIERTEVVDWRGRRACSKKHGGARAATLTCGMVEVLENLVFLTYATNFILYFQHAMHYPTAKAANTVTNFTGTAFMFPLFGGFISDSFLTTFKTFALFCTIELLVRVITTIIIWY
ncbi:hypothetical protein CRG98_020444 [Punica granatum]|uniref:Uncharacterized protein n=1 Tax=Punica granatum TaxID=22663 RepID=A0A2I0JS90_PUNGR|nr:hypothetical protein CRG98_020444 [Punica granatum]